MLSIIYLLAESMHITFSINFMKFKQNCGGYYTFRRLLKLKSSLRIVIMPKT